MKFLIVLFFVSTALLLLNNCNTTEPPPDDTKPTLNLEPGDVSCTEVWLQLNTKDLELPAELILKQYNPTGDSLSQIFILNAQDSLLYIDSLLPNQTYLYQVSSIQQQVSSIKQQITTMDTTSHNFTFQSWTFGTVGSSVLYDVAIINENNIWAVGDIWISDTSSLGYTKYNAVHWDGNQWELKKIMFYTICGQPYTGAYPAKATWIVSENEIWIALDGNQIAKIVNGVQTATICLPSNIDMSISKMWGTSSNDLYIVGNAGNIAHYNGTSWSRIESNTTLNINDIWGDYNPKTGEWEILAVASNKFLNEGSSVMKIESAISLELNRNGLPWSLSSVWFKAHKKYYIGGDGLFFNKVINDNWWKDTTFVPIYKDRVRGPNINDIVISGSNGLFSHFNGISWKHYINNELPYYSGRLLSVDIKNTITVAVGWKESHAIVTMGKR